MNLSRHWSLGSTESPHSRPETDRARSVQSRGHYIGGAPRSRAWPWPLQGPALHLKAESICIGTICIMAISARIDMVHAGVANAAFTCSSRSPMMPVMRSHSTKLCRAWFTRSVDGAYKAICIRAGVAGMRIYLSRAPSRVALLQAAASLAESECNHCTPDTPTGGHGQLH